MKKKSIGALIILLIITALIVFMDYKGLNGDTVTVTIPQGSGASAIVRQLKENGVIRFPRLFSQYIKKDAAHLRAGVHIFTKSMGYADTLAELKRDVPLENTVIITIPEGYEAREIGMLLEENGITTAADFSVACQDAHGRYDFLPADGKIEGYLFPATYELQKGSDTGAVVDKMLESFIAKMLTTENKKRAEEMGMSFHEALTLASIIEREAALDEERALVASVFHNRLKINMRLESCATVQYILEERKDVLSVSDTKIESPYNTYLYAGLPPSPIASPGEESLQAALYPADTGYLFFVANGSGGHTFSETYAAHIQATNN